jgi:hypothetical protein
MMGSNRYVIVAPGGETSGVQVRRGTSDEMNEKDKASFVDVAKICMLIVPFNM